MADQNPVDDSNENDSDTHDDVIIPNAPSDSSSETSSQDVEPTSDETNAEPIESDSITFNKNLAASHTYLGEDLEELHGCTVLPDREEMVIPILLNEIVLFPYKALPLSFEGDEVAFVENHLKTSNAIVVAAPIKYNSFSHSYTVEFGCTAEIHNKTYDYVQNLRELTVTTLGRQRVKIIRTLAPNAVPISFKLQLGVVHALPDNQLTRIPPSIFNCSDYLIRSAMCASRFVKENSSKLSLKDRDDILKPFRRFKRSGSMLAVQRWSLRRFEEDELMEHAKSIFIEKLGPLPGEMPSEFVPFTYKFAGSLPFMNEVLLDILGIDSPHQRLRYILKCLSESSELHCRECTATITHSKFIFSMSQDGPLANYINPNGFVHDTLTVSKSLNVLFMGRATSEHSWFPGYKWTIMNCAHCRSHLGWKFQATNKELIPKLFYGLTRRALNWKISSMSS